MGAPMLDLASATPQSWVDRAKGAIDSILLDHAHCEKKAASTAINLIFRYQDRPAMMAPLSALAREELEHFELVLGLLRERGIAFGPLSPSLYASKLHRAVRKGEPDQLLDTLLVCALIEARSCERMKLLSEHVADRTLAEFYRSLLACEARHFHSYVALAYEQFDRDRVRARLHELASHEAAVLSEPATELRLHS